MRALLTKISVTSGHQGKRLIKQGLFRFPIAYQSMAAKRTLENYFQHQPAKKRRRRTENDEAKQAQSRKKEALCVDTASLKGIEYKLKDNATVIFYEQFLRKDLEGKLFDELLALNYEQGEFKIFGKSVKTPRMQSWMRDEGVTNEMAHLYQSQAGYAWSESMLSVKQALERLLEATFNYVLINHYRDGSDYIGWHSDEEASGKCTNVIASVSLGGPRRFVLRHNDWKSQKIPKKEFLLVPGSLIVMKDDTQKKWKHTLPKSAKPQNARINLTFRQC